MISSSDNQVIFAGNGQATVFPFTFAILNVSDLHLIRVAADGTETEVVSDYYVDFDKKIVYYPGYAPGAEEPVRDRPPVLAIREKLIIYRDVPITQEYDLPENHPFNIIEDMEDKSCIIDQQLKGEIDRSLKVNRSTNLNNFNVSFPVPSDDNNYGLRITKDGFALVGDQQETFEATIEARNDAQQAAQSANSAAANAANNAVQLAQNRINEYVTSAHTYAVNAWDFSQQAKEAAENAANDAIQAVQSDINEKVTAAHNYAVNAYDFSQQAKEAAENVNVFTPHLEGTVLSWTNLMGKPNPSTIDLARGFQNTLNSLNDTYGDTDILEKQAYKYSTVSLNSDVYTLDTNTINIFAPQYANKPFMLEEGKYVYNGFKVVDIVNSNYPSLILLIFGENDTYYYGMTISQGECGDVYSINKEDGTYDKVIIKLFTVDTMNSVSIRGVNRTSLGIMVSDKNGDTPHNIDISSLSFTKFRLGFMPFRPNTTIKFTQDRPNYIEYTKSIEEYSVKARLAKVLNKGGKIKLIGDSITAGVGGTGYDASSSGGGVQIYGDKYQNVRGHCWANKFKTLIETSYPNVTVNNFGVSGWNSTNICNTMGTIIKDDDDLIICMIGTNNRWKDNPKETLFSDIDRLYKYVKGLRKDIIFMASIPCSVDNENTAGGYTYTMHMQDVDQTYMRFCGENNMEYISVFKLFNEFCNMTGTEIDSYLADGLHPNDKGYDVMFYLIANALGVGTERDTCPNVVQELLSNKQDKLVAGENITIENNVVSAVGKAKIYVGYDTPAGYDFYIVPYVEEPDDPIEPEEPDEPDDDVVVECTLNTVWNGEDNTGKQPGQVKYLVSGNEITVVVENVWSDPYVLSTTNDAAVLAVPVVADTLPLPLQEVETELNCTVYGWKVEPKIKVTTDGKLIVTANNSGSISSPFNATFTYTKR